MSYNNWLSAKDIPTVRRLDYIVEGTDNMKSGYLYAMFRNMPTLSKYNNPNLTDERKNEDFTFSKRLIQEQTGKVNEWMLANDREIIFTDTNDWRAVGADYDYFWELRTDDQFAKEEAEARLGISGRTPVAFTCNALSNERDSKRQKLIHEYVEALKATDEVICDSQNGDKP